jgi:hypothetical protein
VRLSTKIFIVVGIVLTVIVSYATILYVGSLTQVYSANLLTPLGKAGGAETLAIEIQNTGNSAGKIVVTIASDAFDSVTTDSVNVPAGGTVLVQCTVNVKDVPNGEYETIISYNNQRINQNDEFYVVPKIAIVEQHWPSPTLNDISHLWIEHSHIGTSDSSTFYFKLQNQLQSMYTGLTAQVTIESLTATPRTLQLDDLGPQGKSNEYSFQFNSQNTPPGTYNFNVHIYAGQYKALSDTFTIWVEA